MNKFKTGLALAILLQLPFSVLAEERAILKVSGLVCSFCIQGIKKSFEKTEATESVDVDLDNHQVTLLFKDKKNLTDSEIKKVLESSGYNLVDIKRENKN